MPSKSNKVQTPEQQLRELQRQFSRPVTDNEDLRQPYRNAGEGRRSTVVTETFTTYGAYEDPI